MTGGFGGIPSGSVQPGCGRDWRQFGKNKKNHPSRMAFLVAAGRLPIARRQSSFGSGALPMLPACGSPPERPACVTPKLNGRCERQPLSVSQRRRPCGPLGGFSPGSSPAQEGHSPRGSLFLPCFWGLESQPPEVRAEIGATRRFDCHRPTRLTGFTVYLSNCCANQYSDHANNQKSTLSFVITMVTVNGIIYPILTVTHKSRMDRD